MKDAEGGSHRRRRAWRQPQGALAYDAASNVEDATHDATGVNDVRRTRRVSVRVLVVIVN